MGALWKQGQYLPWTDATACRAASELVERGAAHGASARGAVATGLPPRIYAFGCEDELPAVQRLLQALSSRDLLVPVASAAAARSAGPRTWQPHSPWDEVAFLREELLSVKTTFSSIAVFTPVDASYKRLVRDALIAAHIPVQDPTLPDPWRDEAHWVWWRDVFRAVTTGLKRDDLLALLGPGIDAAARALRRSFNEMCYKRGWDGSARALKAAAQGLAIPEMELTLEALTRLSRGGKPAQLAAAFHAVADFRDGHSAAANLPDAQCLRDFAEHLSQREYLADERLRLARVLPLFEEFLAQEGKRQSQRADHGLWLLAHGVALPQGVERAYVLGAHAFDGGVVTGDPLDLVSCVDGARDAAPGLRARALWESLNHLYGENNRRSREQARARRSLAAAHELVMSRPLYNLQGKETVVPTVPWRALHGEEIKPWPQEGHARSGGHGAVGWTAGLTLPLRAPSVIDGAAQDALAAMSKEQGLRISAFEDYLKCPFVFYTRHVLKLDEEREPSVELPPLSRGDLLHRVLERFLKQEIESGELPPVSQLAVVLDEELLRRPLEGQFRDPHLQRASRARLLARLEYWHSYERKRREDFPALRPIALEHPLTFSLPSGFALRGRADRIDGDGSSLVVIDYKSGNSTLAGKDLLAGHGAQLVAYAAAARIEMKLEPAAAWYLELGASNPASKGFFLKAASGRVHKANARNGGLTDGVFDDVLHGVLIRWEEAALKLQSGDFSPKPAQPKNCARCSQLLTCGYPLGSEESEGGADVD